MGARHESDHLVKVGRLDESEPGKRRRSRGVGVARCGGRPVPCPHDGRRMDGRDEVAALSQHLVLREQFLSAGREIEPILLAP